MSYRSIVETLLFLEQFRNIDLFQQGFYFVKLYLYYDKEDCRVFSNPYSFYKATSKNYLSQANQLQITQAPQRPTQRFHQLRLPQVNNNENSYQTSVFYIRYAEEKVDFNDVVCFRSEIDTSQNIGIKKEENFCLKCELMFLEANEQEIKNPKNIRTTITDEQIKKFNSIASKVFKVKNVIDGVNDYFPIAFDSLHFSSLNISIHSALIDFKKSENSYKTIENGIRVVRVKQNQDKNNMQKTQKKIANLAEFLFADDKEDDEGVGYLPIEVEKKDIENIHHQYIQSLINIHDRLKKSYKSYLKLLPSEIVNILDQDLDKKFSSEVPQLIITHEAPIIQKEDFQPENEISNSMSMLEQEFNGMFQKLNCTLINKSKSEMESRHQSNQMIFKSQKSNVQITSCKKIENQLPSNNKQIIIPQGFKIINQSVNTKQKQKYESKSSESQQMLSPNQGGLKINNLENICTKQKLDSMSKDQDLGIQLSHTQLQVSNMLKRQQQNSLERISCRMFIGEQDQKPGFQESPINLDISDVSCVLDEKPYDDDFKVKASHYKRTMGGFVSFIQSPSTNNIRHIVPDEPLCEGFDAIPEPMTRTVSSNNLFTSLEFNKKKQRTPNNPQAFQKIALPAQKQIPSTTIVINKENKHNRQKSKFSFIQNYSSKILVQNSKLSNYFPPKTLPQSLKQAILTASVPSKGPINKLHPTTVQPHLQRKPGGYIPSSQRSISLDVQPFSPEKKLKYPINDISNSSINFSEKKNEMQLNIPSIRVNERNFHMINNSKSFLGIFLAQIRNQRDPNYVTKVVDSEIRQISVQIMQLWHKIINIYCTDTKGIGIALRHKYQKKMYKKVSLKVITNQVSMNQTEISLSTNISDQIKASNSINEIRQFSIVGLKNLNYLQEQSIYISTQRNNSLSNNLQILKQKNKPSISPIQSFKHKMSHQVMSTNQFNTQGAQKVNSNLGNHSTITLIKKQTSSYQRQSSVEEVPCNFDSFDFDMPNSPTKITKKQTYIENIRKQETENQREKTYHLILEDTDKKFREEYEPLIYEEVYKKPKKSKANMMILESRPHSQISIQSEKSDSPLQKTMITDIFKNLIISGEEKEQKQIIKQQATRNYHLFVFVHGFQASSYDMRALRNQVSLLLPRALCLCSQSNENNTEGSIENMGLNLANEVKKFITEWCISRDGKTLLLKKLSFVGHSLGGLIIRTALPHLKEYKNQMHGYMSLGSPHLGYMYNSTSLFNAGMWVLKSLRKSQCLQQLSMTDSNNKNQTFLYKLSKMEGLNWFKQVIFCSSYQDNYAPHDSARVQICSRAARTDKDKGNIYVKMSQNILEQLKCEQMFRLDVNFKIDERNLDSMIGRTAHILLMECEPLIEILVHRYKDLFCE